MRVRLLAACKPCRPVPCQPRTPVEPRRHRHRRTRLCLNARAIDAVLLGKSMKDWLRFSVCYWHTFRGSGADPFGFPTLPRPWDDGSNTVENAKRRVDVAFEFFTKLGVEYYSFHDVDASPEGATFQESDANFDAVRPPACPARMTRSPAPPARHAHVI